jgi:secondary thiamine-phosphate synthase enzyme
MSLGNEREMKEFGISTRERACLVDITGEVERVVGASGVTEGLCTVFVPHTTAGVTINENADPSVRHDILSKLAEFAPQHGHYRHSEGNADAHIKASLVGSSVQVPVRQGRLAFGTWQGIFLCEFDGPRPRRIWVTIQASQ